MERMIRNLLILLLALSAGVCFAEKKAISPKSVTPSPNFSTAILSGGTLYVSGQVGRDASGKAPESFEAEVKIALDNIGAALKEAGMTFDDVVAVQVYLTDIDLFARMNAVYVTYFKEPRPARTTVGVAKLAGPFRVEITVTAHK